MYNYYLKEILGIKRSEVDHDLSFYCGDAAGRPATNGTHADFSSDDLLFSISMGLKFFTPEMLFKDEPLNFKIQPGLKIDSKYNLEKPKKELSDGEKKLIEKY
jgi:hypothetical protein